MNYLQVTLKVSSYINQPFFISFLSFGRRKKYTPPFFCFLKELAPQFTATQNPIFRKNTAA